MRTSVEENATLGRWMGEKIGKSRGPVAVLLPMKGFSEYDVEGGVFHDPLADKAFVQALLQTVGDEAKVVRLEANINDADFSTAAVDHLLEMMREND
jgi:uncharacterized protein (UPF0261 family)